MSKNTTSETGEFEQQIKIARFLVISSTTVLGVILAVTGDSSLVPFIIAGLISLILPAAVKIFLVLLAEQKRRKIEAKLLQERAEVERIKKEEQRAAIDREFNEGKIQRKRVATKDLSELQQGKESQRESRRTR